MFRLTLKNEALVWNDEKSTYDRLKMSQRFDCENLQQLTGLLEFMVQTSEDELDLTIARREDDND